MALEGIPGMTDTTRSFIQSVRGFMRDHPELNRLVKGRESSDRQIAWAVIDALSEFNGTPHFTTYTLDNLLDRGLYSLMLRMTVVSLMESIAILQTRNHLNYSDGGISVGVNDKTPLLMNWIQLYRGTTEQKLHTQRSVVCEYFIRPVLVTRRHRGRHAIQTLRVQITDGCPALLEWRRHWWGSTW
jgi:hypothetical protein